MKKDARDALLAVIAFLLLIVLLGIFAEWERGKKDTNVIALVIDAEIFKQIIEPMDHGTITILKDGSIHYRRYDK